jgi:predicted RNA-binding protein
MEGTANARAEQPREDHSYWCVYVGEKARDNFDIARKQGIWVAKEKDFFRGLHVGDRVLFVHYLTSDQDPSPRGFPRVGTTAELSGLARSVVETEVTSEPFKASDRIWPDDAYPYRFRFREINAADHVKFNDHSYPVAVVDAVRKSCGNRARPFLADGLTVEVPPTRRDDDQAENVTPRLDLAAVHARFAAALRASHVSFGPRHEDVVRAFVASLATKPLGNLCTGPAQGRMRENGHYRRHQETSTTREVPQFDSESSAPEYPRGVVFGRISLTGRTAPPQA